MNIELRRLEGGIVTVEEISGKNDGTGGGPTEWQDGATRRTVLKASVASLAVAGTAALSGCGPADEPKGEDIAASEGADGPSASGDHNITAADIQGAERVMGLAYTEAERQQILSAIDYQIDQAVDVRTWEIPPAISPALTFDPRLPGKDYGEQGNIVKVDAVTMKLPASKEDIAFAPLTHLAHWVRTRQISSRELTEIYLVRIAKYAPKLECFVTVTDELARAQAAQADMEIAAGNYRGPLHGIPYGMKDLMDTAGIRTTWGAVPYKDRIAKSDGAVTKLLRDAGAVLLGKTTLGAIAYGDIWFDGQTRNPWNLDEGSSGSSAGSASSTAAGLVGFSIGTETWGSIVSPANRCGATGLRPTFGRVSRTGAMALCWSMDKIGAICRSVEDTALVLSAINGFDVTDPSSLDFGFEYDGAQSAKKLRVGYVPSWFGEAATDAENNALDAVRRMGVDLVEVTIPELPYASLGQICYAEAAAAFEELTLSGQDDQMIWQEDRAWPNSWRTTRFLSAVDLINIDRLRRQAMAAMDEVFSGVDVLIGPTDGGDMAVTTNCTGQPEMAMRIGFTDRPSRNLFEESEQSGDGGLQRMPNGISLWGPLFGEANVLLLGKKLESALGVRDERPDLAS